MRICTAMKKQTTIHILSIPHILKNVQVNEDANLGLKFMCEYLPLQSLLIV